MRSLLLWWLMVHPVISGADTATFATFDERGRSGASLNVVFLGGSLTWGAQATDPQWTSYRAEVTRRLEAQYPQARLHAWDAAIGGTGSQLGIFRLERDVLSRKPDLVFLDFTVNDGPYTIDEDKLAAYEAIVRKLVQAGIPVVQALLAGKEDVLPHPRLRPLVEKHQTIARAYGVPSANAVTLIRDRVARGEASPDELWPVPDDAIHPGDLGYALFAESVWQAFAEAVRQKSSCHLPPTMLHADTYLTANRFRLSGLAELPRGWSVGAPHRSAIAYDFVMSRWLDDLVIATSRGTETPHPLRVTVQARTILLFGEVTPSTGKYSVSIDGAPPRIVNPKPAGLSGNMRYAEVIARDLEESRPHVLEILPLLERGEELRIESLCLAGGQAGVSQTP